MGRPIKVPVVVARGDKEGPVFGVTAALHGNEINGIPVIHHLIDRLDLKKLRGTVVAVIVVNVPGYLTHQRMFVDGRDLNHIMPGKPDGNAAEIYGHRLFERIIGQFNYLVDLHTASFGRVNPLYVRGGHDSMCRPRKWPISSCPQIILHDPPSDRTLRGAAMELGIPAITVEIRDPHRFQDESIKRSLVGLRSVLSEVGMLPKRTVTPGPAPILCESSSWIYTDHGGLLEVYPDITEEVTADTCIARLSNIFGDVIREYKAPYDGIVIGKSTNPVGQTGARVVHLGRVSHAVDKLYQPRKDSVKGRSDADSSIQEPTHK
ncbi:MAG: succinylglutamate desuccinylase/aspartoacylase family protein [Myxococcota bacterium]